ncbi:hypothetical protein D3C75_1318700 [compost metagenome]
MAAHVANDHEWQHRIIAASEEFAMTSVLPRTWLTQYEERTKDVRLDEYPPPTGTQKKSQPKIEWNDVKGDEFEDGDVR